ncbi:MAG: hypothetical protein ACR2N6_07650, partial [Miltoncostaeaceae bacterium]
MTPNILRKHEATTTSENPRRSKRGLQVLLALAFSLLVLVDPAMAGRSDLALFSSSSGAAPNVMLMLDDSGSMDDRPSWCDGAWSSPGFRRRWRRGRNSDDSWAWYGRRTG